MKADHTRRWLFGAGVLACVIGVAGSANAVTFPSGYDYVASQTAQAGVDAGVHQQNDSSTIGLDSASAATPGGAIGPGTASSSGSIAITPSPMISAHGQVTFGTPPSAYNTGDGQYGSDAYYAGSLVYYFKIAGPTNSVDVNAKAVGAFATSALPSGGLSTGVVNLLLTQLDTLGDPVTPRAIFDTVPFSAGSYSHPTAAQSGGFTENGTYNLLTDTIYQVALQVIAQVSIVNTGVSDPSAVGGTASVLASLDPTFQVAPGVADPGAYSFAFSDGIGNTPVAPTPLPGALPLFASGLVALGAIGARRKRKHRAA